MKKYIVKQIKEYPNKLFLFSDKGIFISEIDSFNISIGDIFTEKEIINLNLKF